MNEDEGTKRVEELSHVFFDEADALFGDRGARRTFSEAAGNPELWEEARCDPASFLEARGVAIPAGLRVVFREVEGEEGAAGGEDAEDLELLSHVALHGSNPTLASDTTTVAVEASDAAQLVYACKLVEVCKSVSDPHIMGGKILWGCRTVCVGTGWVKRAR
jgi:hypothetical protein